MRTQIYEAVHTDGSVFVTLNHSGKNGNAAAKFHIIVLYCWFSTTGHYSSCCCTLTLHPDLDVYCAARTSVQVILSSPVFCLRTHRETYFTEVIKMRG